MAAHFGQVAGFSGGWLNCWWMGPGVEPVDAVVTLFKRQPVSQFGLWAYPHEPWNVAVEHV